MRLPFRIPGVRDPQPPPRTFRVTRWMRWWVRWRRHPFYNRAKKTYVCRYCGLPFQAANDRIAECRQAACGVD